MQKTFFLFIVYFILLSVTPSCIEDDCMEKTENEMVENYNEVCTPLINCNSCTVLSFQQKYSKNKIYNSKLLIDVINNFIKFNSDFFPSIWQPPKTV